MSLVNLALWGIGVVLVAVGYARVSPALRRYLALKSQQQNIDRYEKWRGGARNRAAQAGPSGADVAMTMLLRRTQIGAGILVLGFLLVFAGFAVR